MLLQRIEPSHHLVVLIYTDHRGHSYTNNVFFYTNMILSIFDWTLRYEERVFAAKSAQDGHKNK